MRAIERKFEEFGNLKEIIEAFKLPTVEDLKPTDEKDEKLCE